jgi:hypothetical protein
MKRLALASVALAFAALALAACGVSGIAKSTAPATATSAFPKPWPSEMTHREAPGAPAPPATTPTTVTTVLVPTPAVGCSTDAECKGSRICVNHDCVEPPPKAR